MESTEGNEPTLSQAGLSGWTITYISKKTKNPAKAMQLYTYLLDDPGQYLVNFGIEGRPTPRTPTAPSHGRTRPTKCAPTNRRSSRRNGESASSSCSATTGTRP
ncbi:MAG: hypothetical protein LL057_05145 [Bifidobacterium breve]|nr:hypothetical protein [Bifidobacterium breve]